MPHRSVELLELDPEIEENLVHGLDVEYHHFLHYIFALFRLRLLLHEHLLFDPRLEHDLKDLKRYILRQLLLLLLVIFLCQLGFH